MKIAVYTIAKNEQKHVQRFMDSCDGADIVVAGVDPGDTTGDMLEARGAKVIRVNMPQFRFDQYRNEVLKHVPDDIDICVSLDLDETLQKGWRKILERDWKPGTTKLYYWLQWNENHKFFYDRIHIRHGYQWRHANHEGVYPIDPLSERISRSELVVTQQQDAKKDRSKNLGLLKVAVDEDPDSLRMNWYLGREYLMLGKYEECIKQLRKYLRLRPVWSAERCWACIFIAQAYDHLDLRVEGEAWLHAAIRSCPNLRDPYFELAKHYAVTNEWKLVLQEIDEALRIIMDNHRFMHSNGSFSEQIYYLKGEAHFHLDEREAARIAFRRAQRIHDTPEIREWLDIL